MAYNSAQEEFAALTADRSHNHSQHPEDAGNLSDSSVPGSDFSRESSPHSAAASPTMPSAVYHIPTTHFESNTGPKGVIADAQSFDRARKRTLRQTIYGLGASVGNNVIGVSEKISNSMRSSSQRRGSRSSSDNSDQEEDFMRSWREKRVLELKDGNQIRTRRLSPSKRRWGHLTTVDAIGYLDAVEKVASDVMVVVMISDDEVCCASVAEKV